MHLESYRDELVIIRTIFIDISLRGTLQYCFIWLTMYIVLGPKREASFVVLVFNSSSNTGIYFGGARYSLKHKSISLLFFFPAPLSPNLFLVFISLEEISLCFCAGNGGI